MKVLFVIPALASIYGGPSKIAPSLAAYLSNRGVKVDIATTAADGATNLAVPLKQWEAKNNYRVIYFPRFRSAEYKVSISLLRWLWKNVRTYNLVHLHSVFNFPVLAGACICQLRRTPYLVTPHGMLEPWALAYKAWKKKIYYYLVERPFVLRGARAIHALSANEAANIEALNIETRVFVLPNGIDPDETIRNNNADAELFLEQFPFMRGKTIILFLHRIDPKKGLDLLAQAYAVVRPRFERLHLAIAGHGNADFTKTARSFFFPSNGNEAVTFTGMLEGPLKRGAFAAASAFVAPSYSEGFSISILEAMAAGLPCVITTSCNFAEAGEANVARVVPAEVGAFAGALTDVLADPIEARAMGARAREFVLRNYTWDKVAQQFEMILKNLQAQRAMQPDLFNI